MSHEVDTHDGISLRCCGFFVKQIDTTMCNSCNTTGLQQLAVDDSPSGAARALSQQAKSDRFLLRTGTQNAIK